MVILIEKSFAILYLIQKRYEPIFAFLQGCGYPPSVNCTTWVREFGRLDSTFPCYYARSNQSLAITHLDTATDLRDLLMSTTIPLTACLVSGIALCLMHTR